MTLYRILSVALFPFLELYLFYRVFKKKEDKKRLKERFGKPTKERPEGQIIWLHAVSVGEANSALILVEELLSFAPEVNILFTSTTLTSAKIIESKLPKFSNRVIHQFLPIDSYYCVEDFFNFWQPRIAIFVESEIWPNLIFEAKERQIETFLVNGRMSEKSAKKWKWAKTFGFEIFNNFSAIFAQSEEDKKRFERLTNKEVLLYGNLKSQAQNLSCDPEKLLILKNQIGKRKFWLAASTHDGEEAELVRLHQILKQQFPDLLTIIILRHPNRAEDVKKLFGNTTFAQRSKNQNIGNATEFYLVDTLGELGIFYSLAPFAFIGGSLVEVGGHNPFEAIKLGCAVISGRHTFNFKEIYKNLAENNAAIIVNSTDELAGVVGEFLQDANFCEELAHNAEGIITFDDNIAGKIVTKIDEILVSTT